MTPPGYTYVLWLRHWLLSLALAPLASCLLVDFDELRSCNAAHRHFDYVVLGGGTAGLVVAARLSEDADVTVAVIEAGDFQRHNPNVTNTTVLGIAKGTEVDWLYQSVPQVFVGNQSLVWSAGKGVGGSSLINGGSTGCPLLQQPPPPPLPATRMLTAFGFQE